MKLTPTRTQVTIGTYRYQLGRHTNGTFEMLQYSLGMSSCYTRSNSYMYRLLGVPAIHGKSSTIATRRRWPVSSRGEYIFRARHSIICFRWRRRRRSPLPFDLRLQFGPVVTKTDATATGRTTRTALGIRDVSFNLRQLSLLGAPTSCWQQPEAPGSDRKWSIRASQPRLPLLHLLQACGHQFAIVIKPARPRLHLYVEASTWLPSAIDFFFQSRGFRFHTVALCLWFLSCENTVATSELQCVRAVSYTATHSVTEW